MHAPLRQSPAHASHVLVTVAITAPFRVAFSRAQADSTGGISRERAILNEAYERWPSELEPIDADVLLDTSQLDIEETTERIHAAIGSARSRPVLR